DVLFAGFRQCYREGRKACVHAFVDQSAEAFHDWRKRVKEHLYHTRLLHPVWPAVMQAREEELALVAKRLGDHHNLAVFRQWLLTEPAAFPADSHGLAVAAESLQKDLEHAARSLGVRLYAEKPKSITRRTRGWWDVAEIERQMPLLSIDFVAAAGR